MAIEFKYVRVNFDATKKMVQRELASANFSENVKRCGVALNGFDLKFSDSDRPLHQMSVNIEDTTLEIASKNVSVKVAVLMRDKSGYIDDRYQGYADVLFIAETW